MDSICTAPRLSLFLTLPCSSLPPPRRLVWARGCEGMQPGQPSPIDRGTFHTMWRSAQHKLAQAKEEEGEMFLVIVFVFPRSHWVCWGPAFWKVAEHLPSGLLKHTASAFPIKLPLSLSMSLLIFLLSSPHLVGEGSEQVTGCMLLGRVNPLESFLVLLWA